MVVMQTRREPLDNGMTLLPPLEQLIPAEHRLRKLNRVLDLSFIHDAVRDRYCQDNGRPSIDPEVVMRLFILQAIEGIRSVRELMNEVRVNLAYLWFIGYRVDEPLPDHSSLSRALDRFGTAVFDELFRRSIAQCQQSGLIEGKVLHLDATMIRADIRADQAEKPGCSDPDARHPRHKNEPGYKQQTVVDETARVIVDVSVMPANRHEHNGAIDAVDRATVAIGHTPEAVCADRAYANGPNAAAMEERHIRLVSPPQRIVLADWPGDRLAVEDFRYDEDRNVYVCPMGQTLTYIGKESSKRQRRRYRAPRGVCTGCALQARCTRSERKVLLITPSHQALLRLRADAETESFRALYRARAPVIEGVFAEEKQWHGLRRAWRRGLCNMLIQSLLTAAVINCKRLMALIGALCHTIIEAIWQFWESSNARTSHTNDHNTLRMNTES
jgi:transposase